VAGSTSHKKQQQQQQQPPPPPPKIEEVPKYHNIQIYPQFSGKLNIVVQSAPPKKN
jgi:hypothetical protein